MSSTKPERWTILGQLEQSTAKSLLRSIATLVSLSEATRDAALVALPCPIRLDPIHEMHPVVRPGLLVRIINKVALHPPLGLQSHQQHSIRLIAVAAMSHTREAYKTHARRYTREDSLRRCTTWLARLLWLSK